MRRRAAIEPVIGHLKGEPRIGRNHLAHFGDAINAMLAAAGYNFSLLLIWQRLLLLRLLVALRELVYPPACLKTRLFMDD
jgi:transposase, IS5 family